MVLDTFKIYYLCLNSIIVLHTFVGLCIVVLGFSCCGFWMDVIQESGTEFQDGQEERIRILTEKKRSIGSSCELHSKLVTMGRHKSLIKILRVTKIISSSVISLLLILFELVSAQMPAFVFTIASVILGLSSIFGVVLHLMLFEREFQMHRKIYKINKENEEFKYKFNLFFKNPRFVARFLTSVSSIASLAKIAIFFVCGLIGYDKSARWLIFMVVILESFHFLCSLFDKATSIWKMGHIAMDDHTMKSDKRRLSLKIFEKSFETVVCVIMFFMLITVQVELILSIQGMLSGKGFSVVKFTCILSGLIVGTVVNFFISHVVRSEFKSSRCDQLLLLDASFEVASTLLTLEEQEALDLNQIASSGDLKGKLTKLLIATNCDDSLFSDDVTHQRDDLVEFLRDKYFQGVPDDVNSRRVLNEGLLSRIKGNNGCTTDSEALGCADLRNRGLMHSVSIVT